MIKFFVVLGIAIIVLILLVLKYYKKRTGTVELPINSDKSHEFEEDNWSLRDWEAYNFHDDCGDR